MFLGRFFWSILVPLGIKDSHLDQQALFSNASISKIFDKPNIAYLVNQLDMASYLPDRKERINNILEMVTMQMQIGLCLPDSCTPGCDDREESCVQSELIGILAELAYTNNFTVFPFPYFYKDINKQEEWTKGDSVAVAVISCLSICIIIGTLLDIGMRHGASPFIPEKVSLIFQGFSLYTVLNKVFHVSENKDGLASINGIRFWSMVWVIVGHTYLVLRYAFKVGNQTFQAELAEQTSMRLILNATESVDSFFMIGGCLLSYLTLKELKKLNGGSIQFWIMFYVHRYIRLTGAYAGVLLFAASLAKYLPYAIMPNFIDTSGCIDEWWTNLLYINNFNAMEHQQCLGQTWYLAVEMQLFIITPIILFLMHKHSLAGNIFTGKLDASLYYLFAQLKVIRNLNFLSI